MLSKKYSPHAKNLRFGRYSEVGRVYFITKCIDRSIGIKLTNEPIATCICDAILHRKRSGDWHLLSFVLMPDHMHLLIALGENKSLSKTIASFSQFTSSRTNSSMNRKGSIWQHGFYEHTVRKAVEKCPALTEYIHQNPVRKGLCHLPEQWIWSTANVRYTTEVETEWFW
jgi:putative transposase